jgi:mitogen-activated protein kinase kinase kinase 5
MFLLCYQLHLGILMRGLKDYLPEQNREVIESAIHTLKEELDFDAAAINQLYLAIYAFQEAVRTFYNLIHESNNM